MAGRAVGKEVLSAGWAVIDPAQWWCVAGEPDPLCGQPRAHITSDCAVTI